MIIIHELGLILMGYPNLFSLSFGVGCRLTQFVLFVQRFWLAVGRDEFWINLFHVFADASDAITDVVNVIAR